MNRPSQLVAMLARDVWSRRPWRRSIDEWQSYRQYMRAVARDGGRSGLALQVAAVPMSTPTIYQAVALEAPRPPDDDQLQGILDNHAHRLLGQYDNAAEAREACDRFAARWLAGDEHADRCGCGEIEDP